MTTPDNTPTPPIIPEPKKRVSAGKVILWTVIVVLALGLLASLGNNDDDNDAEAGATTTTLVDEPTTTIEEVEVTQPVADGGDWASRDDYIFEVSAAALDLGDIMGTVSTSSSDVANGVISTDTYVAVLTGGAVTINGYINDFEGKTPPDGLEETHDYFVSALNSYYDGLTLAAASVIANDVDGLNTAADKIADGNTLLDLATASLPSS